ncbi:pre-miRNA 5'-monophosphate methyltransferase-like [Acanthaster planci]|uniref:RNA methyltransferase n=1 Tax=Acanthaster planci TaxID=133434 RepID=A0A8B7XGG2_ACAPL|nr:pre-miRNA 5'-monophosphate methyltransferase-like [Acanthaster planci]
MAAPMEAWDRQFHPGAAPFGNFINYYSFNPPEKRIRFLPEDLLNIISYSGRKKNATVLDIGCNSGDLTVALYMHLKKQHLDKKEQGSSKMCLASADENDQDISSNPAAIEPDNTVAIKVLGCDIDDTLITRANESNLHPESISFHRMDFMCDASRSSNLTEFLSRHSETSGRFDLVCCFSLTMWIHLQHGDAGLHKFLKEASLLSRFLLVEPQPWKCYKSAVRRVRKVGIENSWHFKELNIRDKVEEDIINYLTSTCQMELVRTLGETHWERKLFLFRNATGVSDTQS